MERMRNVKKSKGVISLILIAVLTGLLGFTTIHGWGKGETGAAKNINLGLDLEGGVSITYQVKGDTPSEEDMADTIYKLQKRVEGYSTEATVYQEGDDRISIEIPGVSDANAILDELGRPGSLYFIAQTDSEGNLNYKNEKQTGNPEDYKLTKSIEELQKDGSIVLTGTDVKNAEAVARSNQVSDAAEYAVALEMNKDGAAKFAEATKKALESKESIGIYYDDAFVTVPNVNSEIKDGRAEISGAMDYTKANALATTIRSGALNLELEELRSNVVGAQLGQDAIKTSLIAGAIGLAIVFVFMCVVYLLPGFDLYRTGAGFSECV